MDAGLLPVKPLAIAKARLASRFDEDARLAVARALLADALDLCAGVTALQWSVVTADQEVADAAKQRGFAVVHDDGAGLNEALAAAIASLSADSVTVIPSDIPLAAPHDLADVLDTGATSDVVVVPSRTGGTNALYLSPPNAIASAFGPNSLAEHVRRADAAGLRCSILDLPHLSLDLDTGEDVDELLRAGGDSRTAELLATL